MQTVLDMDVKLRNKVVMFRRSFALLSAVLIASCAPSGDRGPVVLAASSLQQPLEELADSWAANGNERPVLSFASSAALARQIDSGTAADLFVSADRTWTDFLVKQGRIDDERTRLIAGNSLALVANKEQAAETSGASSLAADLRSGSVAIGDPDTVPLGRYTKSALAAIGVWGDIADTAVPASSAQQTVRLVSRGETDLGIIYLSDTIGNQHVRVLHKIKSADPIRYVALQLPASAHPDAAEFLDYLVSKEAQAVLQQHGFTAP